MVVYAGQHDLLWSAAIGFEALDTTATSANLLAAITRCPIAERCLDGEALPCSEIVKSQGITEKAKFQVPEPWSGHIASAPILFLSSNPRIDPRELYPLRDWPAERTEDFFENRFEQRLGAWVNAQMHSTLAGDPPQYADRHVVFWSAARMRASELLGRPALAGDDYVMSEVVHCKSRSEQGVNSALGECVNQWLRPVVHASGAPLVVLLGDTAHAAFASQYPDVVTDTPLAGPLLLEGVERLVLQLPHPNAREPRRNCAPLSAEQLEQARAFLRRG